jgi:phage tail sheath gpL-like
MDQILKLQPHRTMHLQGFDSYGAAAALWGASDTGFSLSGVFRDQGDFAVLVLFQKDDPFGHPRFAYLPDGNFTGLKLDLDIEWQGIQAFESKRWPWIDWAYLNAYDANGNLVQHPLKQLAAGPSDRTGASGVFTLEVGAPTAADRVTLWYQNRAFDYTVQAGAGGTSCIQAMWWQPASSSCEQDMWWQSVSGSCVQAMWWQGDHESCIQAMWWQGNANYTHYVQIQSQSHGWNHIYGVQEDGLNSAGAAQAIAAQINSTDPYCGATVSGAYGNEITVFLKTLIPLTDLVVSSSDGSASATLTMYVHWVQIGGNRYQTREDDMNSAQVAQALAGQINSSDPNCTATVGGAYNNEITIALKSGVAGPISVSSSDGSGTATLSDYVHWAQIGSARYSCNQGALSSAQIAANIAGQIAASDLNCTATAGGAQGNGVMISLRSGVMGPVQVSSSDGSGLATLGDYNHWVQIDTAAYSCAQDGLSAADVATNIANQIAASDPNCTATAGGDQGNEITVALRPGIQGPIPVTSSDGSDGATLTGLSASEVCSNIADQINAVDWSANGPVALSATASENTVTITAEPGADGNAVTFYELHASDNLKFTPATIQLAGGSSDNVLWHVSVDFDALGWTDLTKLWLTFAPALANSTAYTPTEWSVQVTNWTVADPYGVRPLKVAGPGSVRIEEDNPWVARAGYWEDPSFVDPKVPAYWSRGRSIRSAYSAYETRTLTIETHCQSSHDIYLGTWLDSNCGFIQATLDGAAPVALDCYGSGVLARRLLFANVPAGEHSIVLEMTSGKNPASGGWYFYFDYLECAVPGDVPDAPQTRGDLGLSADFDTDHTYKISPQRLIWHLQKLGLVGEVDHYCGVFWWNQRKAVGGQYPRATVTFSGSFADQDVIWVHVGDGAIGKTAFPADTPETIAAHFAYFINATLVGVWAAASGPVLTITCRSTGVNWQYSLSVDTTTAHGAATVTGILNTGAVDPTWVIDPAASQTLNRAFRDWHADYFAALKAAGIGVTVSFSQELVNPPDDPGSGQVWVQRFPGGIPVETDTGFASLKSSMCAFSAAVESYMASAYAEMAGIMAAAVVLPRLQFGEVLWWYIQGATGMAFYDADTAEAALGALGRPLATFLTANDDPSVNGYADANFLRARLGNYVAGIQSAVLAQTPSALFELLWPMDVNDPDRCRLLRYVNLPPAWQSRTGSGFDTVLCEGFQYAGVDHNLDTAKRCAAYPFAEFSWDRAHCRYLMGWYNLAWPWQREYQAAQRTGVPVIKFWAYDHLCLYGWPLPLPKQPSNPSFI